MVAWFVIALATLTVFGFLALNAAENISGATDLAARTETIRRMDAAVTSLLALARSPTSSAIAYLPVGRVSGSSYILPANLDQFARTPFGQPIVYCPFGGAETGTAGTITSANATSYNIQTVTLSGVTYVVGGRPSYAQVSTNANLLGWLIAPRTRYDSTPSCNQVSYNSTTGKFMASNAIVRPIIRTMGPEELRELATREIVWFVSPTGTGRGTSSADPSSLASALDFWKSRQPYAMRIKFANGTYSFTAGSLNIDTFTNLGTNGTLYLDGNPGNVTINQSASDWVQLPVALEAYGVTFNNNTRIIASRGQTVRLRSSSSGVVFASSGGQVVLEGSTVTSTDSTVSPVNASPGGTITFRNANTLNAVHSVIWADTGGAVNLNNATLTINRSSPANTWSAIYILPGASLSASFSNIIVSNQYWSVIQNQGNLSGKDLTLTLNAQVNDAITGLDASSVTALESGSITGSTRPVNGFNDSRAGRVAGSGFVLRASSSCWTAATTTGIFSQSANSGVGASTAVLADVAVSPLTATTAASISSYAASLQTNQLRANLRNVNSSNWTCN